MPTKPKSAKQPIADLRRVQISASRQPDGSLRWSYTPPPLDPQGKSWRFIWCAGYDVDAEGKKHYHHLESIPCHCPPGPQWRQINSGSKEIACAGGRGSAKSEGTFAFLTRGNLTFDADTMEPVACESNDCDMSYLSQSDYSFLVLRKNAKDLQDYFKRATRYFALWGGEMTQEPMGVRFPTGAYGIFDHLADEGAYEKYVGQQFTRVVIEEANQIPEEGRYLKVKASCRTANPKMTAQVMLTFNPGGAGARWIKARFRTPGGMKVSPGTRYVDPSGNTRILIFSTVSDNPYLMQQGYDKDLDSLQYSDPTLYKQWRLGDMDAVEGQYFPMFRESVKRDPQGKAIEAENACHCIGPRKIDPYYSRAIACDWGYSHASAVYWGAWTERKQLEIYREFVANRMGAMELGAEIARRSLDDLKGLANPHLQLYLSHDAFARESEGATEAERIREGIDRILGSGSAFIFDRTEEERLLGDEPGWESVKRRAEARRKSTYITVINAGLKRRGNLNLIRDYMRWTPIDVEHMEFKPEIFLNLLQTEGEYAAQEYSRKCERAKSEVLPILQIHYDPDALDPRDRGCEKLVTSIQAMVEKPNNTEEMEKTDGDDPVDALAYLVGNFRYSQEYLPDEEVLRRKLEAIRAKNPQVDMGGLVRAFERAEWEHKHSRQTGGFNVPRAAGRHGRHARMAMAGVR